MHKSRTPREESKQPDRKEERKIETVEKPELKTEKKDKSRKRHRRAEEEKVEGDGKEMEKDKGGLPKGAKRLLKQSKSPMPK